MVSTRGDPPPNKSTRALLDELFGEANDGETIVRALQDSGERRSDGVDSGLARKSNCSCVPGVHGETCPGNLLLSSLDWSVADTLRKDGTWRASASDADEKHGLDN